MPLEFERLLTSDFADLLKEKVLAVAVSGGPDSMALTCMLSRCLSQHGHFLHALTVDHGLRPESTDEARQVGVWLGGWPGVEHHVLTWDGPKPDARIQEAARAARYGLMEEYCRKASISTLFLAHHRDDQAETVLLRLAAGSGLDGLGGMQERSRRGSLMLARPLLSTGKGELLEFCQRERIPFVEDPSNHSDQYARVRLRAARSVLEQEGLTSKRLSQTSRRLARARRALEFYTQDLRNKALKINDTNRAVYDKSILISAPEDIVFRVLESAFSSMSEKDTGFGPRTERIESITRDLLQSASFRKRTLGGIIVSVDPKKDEISFQKENAKKP